MEPRQSDDYTSRQVEAARRTLVDVHQVLASFHDCLVLVGGWVPDLLLSDVEEPHVGSVDVDLALDVEKLGDGRYAELINLLLDTGRYQPGEKGFQFVAEVDLVDGEKPVVVAVEFLAPQDVKFAKNRPKLLKEFRILQADGCEAAFRDPVNIPLSGKMIGGADNRVYLRVASLADFLVMKAHAIGGRDKPKDVYDFCYCLENYPDGLGEIVKVWRSRKSEQDVAKAIQILQEKFETVTSYGPNQAVEFYNSPNEEEHAIQSRRAFELVKRFLQEMDE